MAETRNYMEKGIGCGLVKAISQHGIAPKARKSPPILSPLPTIKGNYAPKRRHGSSGEMTFSKSAKSTKHHSLIAGRQPTQKSTFISPGPGPSSTRRPRLHSIPKPLRLNKVLQFTNTPWTRKLRKEQPFTESETSTRIAVRKKSKPNRTLYHASSGNPIVIGHVGNLNQTGHVKTSDYRLSNHKNKETSVEKTNWWTSLQLGNKYGGRLVNKLDPEVLKNMGNEKYNQGSFEEALALYNEAIGIDSSKASYYSNRSAALIGLGRLLEAVLDCRVAIWIEPSYRKAHYRLATLYLRLGEAEKALCHYKCSGLKAETKDILQAQALEIQLGMCVEARKIQDWNTLLKNTQTAVHLGADSALQIYAMQVEALLNLHRHQEAFSAIQKGPNFDVNIHTQLFGSAITANLLTIRVQANIAAGRFEEAMTAAQHATELDSRDEVKETAKRAQAVTIARSIGNKTFKESKFSEACIAYSEGLKHEPYNSVLLCNRAACLYKLRQFEKAVEDCTTAINLWPSYAKARINRAGCYAKLERWEAAIQDYEVLVHENPGNDEVEIALIEARIQLKKQCSEDAKGMKSGSKQVNNFGKEHYGQFLLSPGISAVLFYDKACHNQALQFMSKPAVDSSLSIFSRWR